MNTETAQEVWQVESNGEIFDTSFAELTSLIDHGKLARAHKVRKGNLRWIEAGRVPSLMSVFNAKDHGQPVAPVITATMLAPSQLAGTSATNPVNAPNLEPAPATDACSMHPDIEASFVCDTCANQFCKACPNSYGGTVKICPFCGALCKPIEKAAANPTFFVPNGPGPSGSFGFGDLGEAFAYPFKYKTSLILGAIMFAFFSVGQGAVGFGGVFMIFSALTCFLMANTLTFGVLANTVENFSQGKIGLNFMPSFDDFSIWDDVVHPFFLSIGVYIVSFGPLLAVGVIAFFTVVGTYNTGVNQIRADGAKMIDPGTAYAVNSVQQAERLKGLVKNTQDQQKERIEAMENGEIDGDQTGPVTRQVPTEEQNFDQVNQMIQEQRKAQLESTLGKAPETIAKERDALVKQILGYGLLFLLLGGICLLWGLFYFPAANIVAGYTRSFMATLNPTVGFDTIKRLGGDYVKILAFGLLIAFCSGAVGGVLGSIFAAFDMPGVGNVPARAIGALFGFYFSVVFSCMIGFALYKNAHKLKLPS